MTRHTTDYGYWGVVGGTPTANIAATDSCLDRGALRWGFKEQPTKFTDFASYIKLNCKIVIKGMSKRS